MSTYGFEKNICKALQDRAVDLGRYNCLETSNLAWRYEDAISLAEELKRSNKVIIGGEVVYIDDDVSFYPGDKWVYNYTDKLPLIDNVINGYNAAQNFLAEYWNRKDAHCFYVIAIKRMITYGYEKIINKDLLDRATDLGDFGHLGTSNLAWNYSDAFYIAEEIKENNKIILGGDVVYIDDKNSFYPGDNWYFDVDNNKPLIDNVMDGYNSTLNYLYNYWNRDNKNYYYVFVV